MIVIKLLTCNNVIARNEERKKMKLTHKNLKKVFDYIESQIEDENGRGEFDEETPILSAVERTIEMLEEKKGERKI